MLSLPIPFSEGPSQPSSDPFAQNRGCRKCHCHPEKHSAKCAHEITVWQNHQSKVTHLSIRSYQVQLAWIKSCTFHPDYLGFFCFLCSNVSSKTVSLQQKPKPEICSCGTTTCFSPHMLKALWQDLLMLLLTDAHLYLPPQMTNIKLWNHWVFLKINLI